MSAEHPLARLFDPRGVAVIGASETPGKYGHILLKTLIEEKYAGRILPINPKGGSLLGHRFLRSLEEAGGPVDVALIVRPADQVLVPVTEAARSGVPFAIVYAAGFSELGDDGRRMERDMLEAAAAHGMRIVGPNCMNIFSAPARLNLSAIVPFPEGDLGLLSASGNLGYALAHEASVTRTVGFSRFISAGNQADLALHDYLDYLRVDPHTRAILIFTEGVVRGLGREFVDAVAAAAAVKPVLVLRGGRTAEGRGTARSHTGALAGEAEVMRQGLEQAGAVLLDRADEALPVAQAFLESPLPRGRRTALVGEGGGHATLLTDAASEAGLALEPFPDDLVRTIRPHLPPFVGIVRNPVEFGGQSEYDIRVYEKVLKPVVDWDGCDQIILFGGYALHDAPQANFLAELRARTGKPILIHDLYAGTARDAIRLLRERRLPLFQSVEVAARAAAALARGTRGRERAARAAAVRTAHGTGGGPREAEALPPRLRAAIETAGADPPGAAAGSDGPIHLLENDAADLLSHYGVPVLPAALARDEEAALRAAGRLGYPVVLKIHSKRLLHKSDAGGVHLDLRDADRVREAFRAAARLVPGETPEVRLTPYMPGGIEVIVGGRRDPQFGPILLFGTGGVLAEFAMDRAIRLLPCQEKEIAGMIASTRAGRLLEGFRGTAPADARAVLGALRAVARLILAQPAVQDAEINPLRCAADGAVALDARVIVRT